MYSAAQVVLTLLEQGGETILDIASTLPTCTSEILLN